MTENYVPFRTVMRGYEPAEVDRRFAELAQAHSGAEARVADLLRQVSELSALLEVVREEASSRPEPKPPTFSDFGARVSQILSLAEEEANELKSRAVEDAKAKLVEHEDQIIATRAEADRYAADIRSSADVEASRIVEEAKRSADQIIDEADRHASARRQEAEALHEEQRAKAARAAADFERTLALRRDKAEKEARQRSVTLENELREAQEHAAQLREHTEHATAEANRKASMTVAEAEQKAEQIVAAAVARAERIRLESSRELAAAAQRRDSINAQLTNVRQMLTTLSGTGASGDEGEAALAQTQPRAPGAKAQSKAEQSEAPA